MRPLPRRGIGLIQLWYRPRRAQRSTLASVAADPDTLSGRPGSSCSTMPSPAATQPGIVAFFRGFLQQGGSAGGSQTARARPSGKPTYTREQIKQLYEQHRRGAYAGREAEWNRLEADIIAAIREGRVQGTYLTK